MALQRIRQRDLREGFRIACWDLETSSLNGSYGRVLCGTIKEIGQPPLTLRCDKFPSFKKEPWNDEHLVASLRDELEKFNVVVSYNGENFDAPMLNTRLIKHGYQPISPAVKHADLIWVARKRMRLSSNSLATLLDTLGVPEQKMHVSPEVWNRAVAGSKHALDLIVERNISDVVALEQAFNKLTSLMDVKFSLIR